MNINAYKVSLKCNSVTIALGYQTKFEINNYCGDNKLQYNLLD